MNSVRLPQYAQVNSVTLDTRGSVTRINPLPLPRSQSITAAPMVSFPQSKAGWDILFTKAKQAKTLQEKEAFRNYLFTEVAPKLSCGSCAQHTKLYLSKYDIREYYYLYEHIDGAKQDVGLFKYIWEFKSDVNKRLGKKNISQEEAWRMY